VEKRYLGATSAPSSPAAGTPDPTGQGALRFTNGRPGGYHQNGAIVSSNTFPTGSGVQVTFKTVTYRGDSGGGARDGADGISFYLMDGSQAAEWRLGWKSWVLVLEFKQPVRRAGRRLSGSGHRRIWKLPESGRQHRQRFQLRAGRIGLRGAGNILVGVAEWPPIRRCSSAPGPPVNS